jgi:hypothetical protein
MKKHPVAILALVFFLLALVGGSYATADQSAPKQDLKQSEKCCSMSKSHSCCSGQQPNPACCQGCDKSKCEGPGKCAQSSTCKGKPEACKGNTTCKTMQKCPKKASGSET